MLSDRGEVFGDGGNENIPDGTGLPVVSTAEAAGEVLFNKPIFASIFNDL